MWGSGGGVGDKEQARLVRLNDIAVLNRRLISRFLPPRPFPDRSLSTLFLKSRDLGHSLEVQITVVVYLKVHPCRTGPQDCRCKQRYAQDASIKSFMPPSLSFPCCSKAQIHICSYLRLDITSTILNSELMNSFGNDKHKGNVQSIRKWF